MGACSSNTHKSAKIVAINHRVIEFKSHELNPLYIRRRNNHTKGSTEHTQENFANSALVFPEECTTQIPPSSLTSFCS